MDFHCFDSYTDMLLKKQNNKSHFRVLEVGLIGSYPTNQMMQVKHRVSLNAKCGILALTKVHQVGRINR